MYQQEAIRQREEFQVWRIGFPLVEDIDLPAAFECFREMKYLDSCHVADVATRARRRVVMPKVDKGSQHGEKLSMKHEEDP